MKHAILVLSSYGIDYLINFLLQFKDINCDLYIHLDGKSNEQYNDSILSEFNNIVYCKHLYESKRYSPNMVLTMFELLKEAQKNNYDYYSFFSESCYLIKNPNEFFNYLNYSNGKSFITYYLSNNYYEEKQLYKSSQWISLHNNIVKELVKYDDKVEEYINAYNNNNIIIKDGALDEIVLQNIIFDDILNFNFDNIVNNSLRYSYFEYFDSPKILETNILHKISLDYIYNNFFIIRKIDFKNKNSIDFLNLLKYSNTNTISYYNTKYNSKCNIWCVVHNDDLVNEYNLSNKEYFKIYNTIHELKGDNINYLSFYFAEISAFYYVWKNKLKSDYIGICHYRRFFNYIDFDKINSNTLQIYICDELEDSLTSFLMKYGCDFYTLYSFQLYLNKKYNIPFDVFLQKKPKISFKNMFIATWDAFCDICDMIFGFFDYLLPNWKNIEVLEEYLNNMYKSYIDVLKEHNYDKDKFWNPIAIRYYTWPNGVPTVHSQNRYFAILCEWFIGIYICLRYNTFVSDKQYSLTFKTDNENDKDKIIKYYKQNVKNGFDKLYVLTNNDSIKINTYICPNIEVIKLEDQIQKDYPNKFIHIK